MKRPSKETIAEALRQTSGLLAPAARALKVARSTLDDWVKADEDLKHVCVEAREIVLDIAEGKLIENVSKGETPAITFMLKTIGRHRGYVDRTDIGGADGGALRVVISEDDAKL